jgi:hypothetical protein
MKTLARLQFKPRGKNELAALIEDHAKDKPWLADSLQPMLSRAVDLWSKVQPSILKDEPSIGELYSSESQAALDGLHALARSLTSEQMAGIASLTSVVLPKPAGAEMRASLRCRPSFSRSIRRGRRTAFDGGGGIKSLVARIAVDISQLNNRLSSSSAE